MLEIDIPGGGSNLPYQYPPTTVSTSQDSLGFYSALCPLQFVSLLAQPTAERDCAILLRFILAFTLPTCHMCRFNTALCLLYCMSFASNMYDADGLCMAVHSMP